MSEFIHILDRMTIHFFSSFGVYLIGYFSLRYAYRKVPWWKEWVGAVHRYRIAIVVWCVFWLGLWEGANVLAGQSTLKLYTDYASWLVGLIVASWALYRYFWAISDDQMRS